MWFVVSILNILFGFLAEKNYDKNKSLSKFYLFLIVINNIIIFGFRDIGVGTDTKIYIDQYFNYTSSLPNIWYVFLDESELDKGFLVLSKIANYFGHDSRILLFITELFIISFVVMGVFKLKKKLDFSITWYMVLFVLTCQVNSINFMRQSCAMTLLLYGYSLLLNNNKIGYIIIQIIAFFFHTTSIIFIMIPLTYYVSQLDGKYRKMYLWGITIFILLFIYFYYILLQNLVSLLNQQEIYAERYGVNSIYEGEAIGPRIYVPFALELLIYVYLDKKEIRKSSVYMFLLLCLMCFLFSLTRIINSQMLRLSFYFNFIAIIYISYIIKHSMGKIKSLCYVLIFFLATFLIRALYLEYNGSKNYQRNSSNLIYTSQVLDINEK